MALSSTLTPWQTIWLHPRIIKQRLFLISILMTVLIWYFGCSVPVMAQSPANGVAQSLVDAREAVIQIEAVGSFADPEAGNQLNMTGRGSGFIISETGIAVTNAHVVHGAASLKVRVGGEGRWLSAQILGVDPCADLAVIQINGNGFTYLNWTVNPLQVGETVYAAGFPLGNPNYTLTRGIVSKNQADGQTSWSSLDYVSIHDARIQPGNSGGPLLNDEGQVVAVNYAGNADINSYLAIPQEIARPIINDLRQGIEPNSIGINGHMVANGQDWLGVWVSAVEAGSSADKAGIEPEDIIISLEDVALTKEGTLQLYCDVLRSHSPTDVMKVVFWQASAADFYEVKLNEPVPPTPTPTPTPPPNARYPKWVTISDSNDLISIDVPHWWSDTATGDWEVTQTSDGFYVAASSDLDASLQNQSASGLFLAASFDLLQEMGATTLLDLHDYNESCDYDERSVFQEDSDSISYMDTWINCGEQQSLLFNIALAPSDESYVIFLHLVVADPTDADLIEPIVKSINLKDVPTDSNQNIRNLSTNHFKIQQINGWTDINETVWESGGHSIGHIVTISPNNARFNKNLLKVPGMIAFINSGLYPNGQDHTALDSFNPTAISPTCIFEGRKNHTHSIQDRVYKGAYSIWSGCHPQTTVYVLSATAEASSQSVLIVLVADTRDHEIAFETVSQSFHIVPSPIVTATVLINRLNVRQGPGVVYPTIGSAQRNEQLTIVGRSQHGRCEWLKIAWPNQASAWVAGGSQYINLSDTCTDVPIVDTEWILPPNGCFHFHNKQNVELTITITSRDGSWNKTFEVIRHKSHRECFSPGEFTYTISTPHDSINGEITVKRGSFVYVAPKNHLPPLQ